jgi:hypothetical protein
LKGNSPRLDSEIRKWEFSGIISILKRVSFKVLMMSIICFQGSLRPEEALQSLTIYEGKFGRLKDDREKCARAKEALELTDTGLLSGSEERVQVNKGPLKDPHEGTTHKALDFLSFVFFLTKS